MFPELLLNSIFQVNQVLSTRYASALMMLTMNFGMTFVMQELAPITSRLFSFTPMRKIVLFAILFTGTRDIIATLVLLFIIILIFDFVLNEKSAWCLIPAKFRMVVPQQVNTQPVSQQSVLIESAPKIIEKQLQTLVNSYKKNILNQPTTEGFMVNSKSPAEEYSQRYFMERGEI